MGKGESGSEGAGRPWAEEELPEWVWPPYTERNTDSCDRRGCRTPGARRKRSLSSEATPPPPSSTSELAEVPSLQSEAELRSRRRPRPPKMLGLRPSASDGEARSHAAVEGGKRKCVCECVLPPLGTGGAL